MREAELALRSEYAKKGKEDTFEMLIPFLIEGSGGGSRKSYQDLAELHGVTDASLRMAANRMRTRYGWIILTSCPFTKLASKRGFRFSA
jgi:hypothetical protein